MLAPFDSGDGAAARPPYVSPSSGRRLGLAIVGFGGAVATTAVAGLDLLARGLAGPQGLPLAGLEPALANALVPYGGFVFGGWDLCGDDLATAARAHGVLEPAQLEAASETLGALRPWPAVRNRAFLGGVDGAHVLNVPGLRAAVDAVRADLRRFRAEQRLDGLVVMNLASTEASPHAADEVFASAAAFEAAVDADDARIPPAMLYAYAALLEGAPYGNFTPSTGADVPALVEIARREGVPVAGKDGKTGQTFLKTLLAPGLKARALEVEGWFSTNILGNRDGEALREGGSLASKLGTKASVLDQILGYEVGSHVVSIHYYKPRGDAKEAWDNVDLVGFLGQRMQLKVNFLCRDSILAAPLAVEIARCLDLAHRAGQSGVCEALGVFFKSPQTADGRVPEHGFGAQQAHLERWLAETAALTSVAEAASQAEVAPRADA